MYVQLGGEFCTYRADIRASTAFHIKFRHDVDVEQSLHAYVLNLSQRRNGKLYELKESVDFGNVIDMTDIYILTFSHTI